MKELRIFTDRKHPLSLRRQCELLGIHRSGVYYTPKGESAENLELMRKMGIMAIYPRKNLSRLGHANYIRPYLLRNLEVTRVNLVWQIDITYIPMKSGFMYLSVIIDVYSRYIVGWHQSNTLEKENQTELLHTAIMMHGTPEIINSDQGAQYTCAHWIDTLTALGIAVSMDGKGRATDNIYIERWFRTLKQRYVYLNPASNGLELRRGLERFVKRYNNKRHQGINRHKPVDLFTKAA